MATKYDRTLRKLENATSGPLFKVWIDYDREETERERRRFMAETRGKGTFVPIDSSAADL